MKKILFITPHLSTGGQPQYLYKKIEHFNQHFDVYCVEHSIFSYDYVVQKNRIKNLLGDKLIYLGEHKSELLRIISEIKPDIIHIEEIPETFLDRYLLKSIYKDDRDYNIVVTTHTSGTDPSELRFLADKFVLVSTWSKRVFDEHFKGEIPCEIWEYPVEKLEPNKEEARKALGFEEDWKHVINVGLFTPGKNQGELFNLASLLQRYKIKFHFIGNQADNFSGYWEPIMKTKPDNCIIHGERSDVDLFYQAADAFYFTSNHELNPLVVKESLSWGLPTFIKKLFTYEKTYDGLVTYIDKDQDINIKNLLDLLKPERIEEIPGWFSYQSLYDFFVRQSSNDSIIVEIGSFLGKSTKYLVDKVKSSNKNIHVVAIDTFKGTPNEDYHVNFVSQYDGDLYQEFSQNVDVTALTVLKENSHDACQYFGNGTIDFLMIDGDHSYEGVTSDIKNYFYKMKPGGFISGDDYNVFDSTTKAVNDFFRGTHHLSHNGINWYYRIPRIQLIHLSTTPMSERAIKSLANIKNLDKYNIDVRMIQNEPYTGKIDMETYRDPFATNIRPAHYGCYLAHCEALLSIDDTNYDYTIIMEEDAYLDCTLKEFVDMVHKVIFACEKDSIYFVGLGNQNFVDSVDYNDELTRCWHQNLAHCYLIPNRYKGWYVDKISSTSWDVADIWYNHIFNMDRQIRLATKKVYSKQIAGVSIIDNVYKQYKEGLMI